MKRSNFLFKILFFFLFLGLEILFLSHNPIFYLLSFYFLVFLVINFEKIGIFFLSSLVLILEIFSAHFFGYFLIPFFFIRFFNKIFLRRIFNSRSIPALFFKNTFLIVLIYFFLGIELYVEKIF